MEAPRYFASYGAYVPVAASVATQQAPPSLSAGLPAPWTTLTQTSTNPFSNFNASIQSSQPVSIAPTNNWVEMSSLQMSPPSSPVQKSAVEPRSIPQPVVPITQEALRRCCNCGGYYKNVNETCRYHPGHYRSAYQSQRYGGGGTIWSCCKAANRDAPGCKQTKHVEDLDASRKMTEYGRLVNTMMPPPAAPSQPRQEEPLFADFTAPVPAAQPSVSSLPAFVQPPANLLIDLGDFGAPTTVNTAAPSSVLYPSLNTNSTVETQSAAAPESGATAEAPGVKVSARQLKGAAPGCIKHFIKSTDTIVGLCMQYNVTKKQLQEVNKGLGNDNLYAFFELQIPQKQAPIVVKETSKEDEEAEELKRRKQALFRFKHSERATDEEARFYLTTYDWDYDQAVRERRLDMEYEQKMSRGGVPPRAEKYEPKNKKVGSGSKSKSDSFSFW